jgi:hypothetical protein
LPHLIEVSISESSAVSAGEVFGQAGDQLLAVIRPLSAFLFHLDDPPANGPIRFRYAGVLGFAVNGVLVPCLGCLETCNFTAIGQADGFIPKKMGELEVEALLTYLAANCRVAERTAPRTGDGI